MGNTGINKKIYLLLIVFFIVYIATGGMFALLGTAWPAISKDLGVPISWQSILIAVIHGAGAFGAATAQRVSAKFGNWASVSFSLLVLTALIFGYSFTRSFFIMPLLGVFQGYFLAMSSTLINGYGARNYKAMWNSWLHCFFSLGSTISPAILSYFMINMNSWRMGYQAQGA
jgi:MFS family permease